MFFEILAYLLALDFGRLFSLFLGNLLWFFMLAAFVYFIMEGKRLLLGMVLIMPYALLLADFSSVSGAVFLTGSGLLLFYLSRIAVVSFVESTPALKRHFLPIVLVQGWAAIIAASLFF
ncbi:MAG: hypothetical protein HY544_02555 [Candidatus Diapherotrites archaeon]|uniref:Uncharacterized protein n=1 Tax=Candidatus Iainarchaeum sp. TaxID=3101447 RepID=A0A8T3YK15_9ARCH|nr:hypothetical protein [Candidatus Diapherotrites archaeon]